MAPLQVNELLLQLGRLLSVVGYLVVHSSDQGLPRLPQPHICNYQQARSLDEMPRQRIVLLTSENQVQATARGLLVMTIWDAGDAKHIHVLVKSSLLAW